jgi:hypothetical protein
VRACSADPNILSGNYSSWNYSAAIVPTPATVASRMFSAPGGPETLKVRPLAAIRKHSEQAICFTTDSNYFSLSLSQFISHLQNLFFARVRPLQMFSFMFIITPTPAHSHAFTSGSIHRPPSVVRPSPFSSFSLSQNLPTCPPVTLPFLLTATSPPTCHHATPLLLPTACTHRPSRAPRFRFTITIRASRRPRLRRMRN